MTAEQSSSSGVEEIRQALAASRERLLDTIRGVTEEQFKRRPPDGGWCIAEVLAHQLASEMLRAERIGLALEHNGAEITPSDPDAHDKQARAGRVAPVPQLIHGLLATRRQIDLLLDRAGSIAGGLERAVQHPRDGRQTVGWMLKEKVAAHEQEHVDQIEALKAGMADSPS